MHPLAPDLSKVNDDELQKKYSDLLKRYNQAYRFGPVSIIPQITMMMEHYQSEIQNRNKKHMDELMKKAEEGGKKFKNIIDIQ